MQRVKRVFSFLLISTFSTLLFASGGKISGRIIDATTGEPLPGANVIIESKWESDKIVEITNKQGASADAEGYYFILNVDPGSYNIKATMIGYAPLVQTQVRANMDRTITVDFSLNSSAIEMNAIEVVAQREIIRPDVSGTQEIITTERLSESPVMRVDEFVDNIKGVELVSGSDGNGLSIRGGGIRETDVRVDGISTRDPRSDNAYLSLNSTSVAELQVLTGGFEAKYGSFRSGLVNVVTKEGSRDKYSISLKVDYTPRNSYKFFGTNPWSNDSWVYKVFSDTTFGYTDANGDFHSFCMDGVTGVPDSLLPEGFPTELKTFRGWNSTKEGKKNYPSIGLKSITKLTADQKRRLWLIQHPQYQFAKKPDVYAEGTITGPVPGKWIPLLGDILEKSTFLLGGKYEETQFAFPIGPRDSYLDINTQLKITTQLTPKMKITLNGLYAKVETNTSNSPSYMGGALIDNSSRFGFLSSTQQSTYLQAKILGSGDGYLNMYNKSRLLYYDQRWLMGGLKFSHAISSRAFQTLELQFAYQDNEIHSFAADTIKDDSWRRIDSRIWVCNYPTIGTPNSSTNFCKDLSDLFTIYGGLQQADSSYSWTFDVNYNLTAQVGHNHQFETGINFRYGFLHINSGTWQQAEKMWTPDTWQYMTVTPIELGVYLQDKLEFQGMIANVGVRGDYFTPHKDAYTVDLPMDEDYANFYNLVYQYLPGAWGS
ncbi:MAG: TonB-dependent receptor, partial [Candidatus Neomarinimicrobiota bacterium]